MANNSGRAPLSKPGWLLDTNRGRRPSHHGSARSASTVQTSLSNHEHIQPRRYSSSPQHGPEPSATAHHIISTSSPPAFASDNPLNPLACGAKRKAPDVAPRGEEQRYSTSRHVATNQKGSGGARSNRRSTMLIGEDEAKRIMMEATAVLKNPTQRVSVSGGEIHPKCATAAIDSDDTEALLSRRKKTRRMLSPDAQLGPPRNQEGAVAPPRECVQLGLGRVPERGGHLNECGEVDTTPTTSHELPIGLLGGTFNLDESPALDPADNSETSSDVQLASRLPPSLHGPKQPRVLVQKPQGRMKRKGKAKAGGPDSVDVDVSKEDILSDVADELRYPSPGPATAIAAAAAAAERPQYTATARKGTLRKSARAEGSDMSQDEEASDDNLAPRVRSARTAPRASKATFNWRFVDPRRNTGRAVHASERPCFPATDLRPRVWTGGKDELFATLPALSKNRGGIAWECLYPTHILFSEEKDDSGLGWWRDDIWEGRRITFSIVREVNVPLQPPVHNPHLAVHGSPLDAGPMPMDTFSLSANSSDLPLSSTYNRESPAIIPRSGHGNLETNGLPEAGPSRLRPDSVPSSRVASAIEVPHSGMNRSSPFDQQGLQIGYDCNIGTGGRDDRQEEFLAEPCLSADYGRNPDKYNPGVQLTMESNCVDGTTALDRQSYNVFTHAGQSNPGVTLPSESHSAESQLPFFPPLPTCNSPKIHTPQVDTYPSSSQIYPQSSALAHTNITLPPCESVSTSNPADIATGRDPLIHDPVLHGSQGRDHFSFPQPPPEVTALLTAQSSDDVVSPVFSRNSPLVRWTLPSEIGHFWSGFFKIFEVKVETSPLRSASNTRTVQRTWRFSLEWVPGGEDLLLDDDQQDYHEWSVRIMQPWWERENILLDHHLSLECSRLLLPLPLLAPFSENSTASGDFPVGYFCTTCGRVNVQRYLRHRICENDACDTKMDTTRDIGWVIGAFSTRDRKINSATISPDDKWAAPTTAEPAIRFDDGTRLFQYHLATPTSSGDSGTSMALASASNNRSNVETNPLSVRHIFNGNRASLQANASELFETLQRDARIERSIGAAVFSTPVFKSRDDPALRRNGRSMWDLQARIIEGALRAYCCDLGALKMQSFCIHAWTSDGKSRQTFCPRAKFIVLLCLGADLTLLSILPDSDSRTKSNSKLRKECLRVTMVHGDLVVLSGSNFEFLLVRTGMCMLLEAECI